jgi:hypothetical protein
MTEQGFDIGKLGSGGRKPPPQLYLYSDRVRWRQVPQSLTSWKVLGGLLGLAVRDCSMGIDSKVLLAEQTRYAAAKGRVALLQEVRNIIGILSVDNYQVQYLR